jgi:hypothetical protein
MRKTMTKLALACILGGALLGPVSPVFAEDAAPAHYSVATTKNGTLIDDPAAAAILKAKIPTVWANEMFQSLGRDITLKEVQQYEPVLTDAVLAEIQAELDKLPAKK